MTNLNNEQNFNELLEKISTEAKEDILELKGKIDAFRNLQIDEEKFRAYRLARGVYGQRQEGVQMIRIKLPYGKVTPTQLLRMADISDKYASKNLHLTTRQDIQIHYVSLENSPKVWAELEEVDVTLREACGNTVRNITASALAGIDPKEPFDVTPYAHEHFLYFLRNPICQEMGRKFKMSFSSNEEDSAFGFMHDLGFIPRIKNINGKEVKGFKVFIGGGLGAQPFLAQTAHEFLPIEQAIPFTEAVIRVFDKYGERAKRHKARLKYLIKDLGLEKFMEFVKVEELALKTKTYSYNFNEEEFQIIPSNKTIDLQTPADEIKYNRWLTSNTFEQKQTGFYGVYVKQHLGDMDTATARVFAAIVNKYCSDDIRITVNQSWLLKFVQKENLPALFNALNEVNLAEPGFDSTADITACPGTDTCNLGISSSTGLAASLEDMLLDEFPDIIFNRNIKIKISGCMNACGQHSIANIGFHGMSIKNGDRVLPAMQVMLGGGIEKDGSGSIADKIIKLPSKNCVEATKKIIKDYEANMSDGEYFNDYYRRQIANEKMYFYQLLKPLADVKTLPDEAYIDWGHEEKYVTAVGVGECAGVVLDLVGTLILDTEEKYKWAQKGITKKVWADAIYSTYVTFVSGSKALLTKEGINCNTQMGIINDFQINLIDAAKFDFVDYKNIVLSLNDNEPTEAFALSYFEKVTNFIEKVKAYANQKETV